MTKHLVQKYLSGFESGDSLNTAEDPWSLSLSIFTFFSNYSSDFPVLLFR